MEQIQNAQKYYCKAQEKDAMQTEPVIPRFFWNLGKEAKYLERIRAHVSHAFSNNTREWCKGPKWNWATAFG